MSNSPLDLYAKGTRAWFEDTKEGWIGAELVEKDVQQPSKVGVSGQGSVKLVFKDANGKAHVLETTLDDLLKTNWAKLPPLRNPPLLEQTEDLTNLSYLNEPGVLHAIRTRYQFQQIYTYSGIVLVAVNPFTAVSMYSDEYVQLYAGKKKGELDPHLFAIAEDAYRCMIRQKQNQTIIVSGESGAGKTVSAKYIMRYFATVEDPEQPSSRRKNSSKDGMTDVERQILATNPIMEAFGNAKTTRNDNSSRFGKYIEILFDNKQNIVGAKIRTYLLERSRLVYQPATERNYHVFYQLLAGASSSDRAALSLDHPSKFAYTNGGGAGSEIITGVDDAADFAATQAALSTVGISSEQQWMIFKVLAGLLHLGNVKITQVRNDAVLADDDPSLLLACKLLGIEAGEFRKWITKKQIVTRSEKIVTSHTAAQASAIRDSVAKYIYSSLFDWLVGVINDSLAKPDALKQVANSIGVLDIYGFEHFDKNSFEQLMINYANERLQYNFNAHVFKLEQDEYVAEQINWKFIDFADNQPCIDMIEGKLGIMSLLDEESRLPAGTDSSFVQKLYSQLGKPEYTKVFKKPRFGNSAFTVKHYALDVEYEAESFLEKNRDTVPDEQLNVLSQTTNEFLKDVFDRAATVALASKPEATSAVVPKRGGAVKKPTLGSIFKLSLIELMKTIDATNAHYIRCIKPNEPKIAWEFEPNMVLGQLRACGVLETIRISCAGYPTRWTFAEFAERYYMLCGSEHWGPDISGLCDIILRGTIQDHDKYQVGKTKIFFRAGMLGYLEKLRGDRLNYLATLLQKNLRRHIAVKKYKSMRVATIGIQATWRGILARRELQRQRQEAAAIAIQRYTRGYVQRNAYLKTRTAVTRIQALVRGRTVRAKFASTKTDQAATLLQSLLRGRIARARFLHERRLVILLQSCTRRRAARKELLGLKQEAKSVSHFKEVSYKLENKVVELTQTLQKRTAENKSLQVRVRDLETSIASWTSKHSEVETEARALRAQAAVPSIPQSVFETLRAEKAELDEQMRVSTATLAKKDSQITALAQQCEALNADLASKQKALGAYMERNGSDETSTIATLRTELAVLREQLSRTVNNTKGRPDAPPVFAPSTGKLNGGYDHGMTNGTGATPPRPNRGRRNSMARNMGTEDIATNGMHYDDAPRGVQASYDQLNGQVARSPRHQYIQEPEPEPEELAEEMMALLEEEEPLDEDILIGIIRSLKIPPPSSNNPPQPKEVLFPAHLISLVTNEMWKYGLMSESERFLANVMQTVQQHVMSFHGEDAIIPGTFWLSNIHEVLSFVCIAEGDILQGIGPGAEGAGRDFEWENYERLVRLVKHDLDSLEYNIYHTFMQETKKKLNRMIIPALVESQSLPGFVSNDSGSGRFFNRIVGASTQPTHSMDDILNLLNLVWKSLKSFYIEHSVVQQVVTELLKLIGVTSFNDLLMRRNFCSWKRAMQIQYNITRLEEWCKAHDMPEGTLQLEHLMQATKLLQLKKGSRDDIEIIYDVCWFLTPTQIQKLISHYHVADYEAPIAPEILQAVAARVVPGDKNDHLLLPPEVEEAGPYDVPLPREITGIETYIPSFLPLPRIREIVRLLT
ncbi:uncharacterized protein L969DRAFT_497598 [Mixia osmundae IAM 14324]|uniref:Myosin motor domain-containing protein n=1 Tax=Mixia osmundae (strain CBS 9802 / IAM 14324 / JCM 22182 / KY 12970) TaxID=764103 RepID=G7E7E7_MIXOS|nr:uncharacterized protein L969DRAFT_497598 [Mixia osmundae IAM 14324]KEI38916.1 hypothetical protein L969DRAFT_497598 [Mixia osmundae IAM 14324]GAA98757.1 hypothetical protein E5Q_05445 [Mixia osmundae IAM 14324]